MQAQRICSAGEYLQGFYLKEDRETTDPVRPWIHWPQPRRHLQRYISLKGYTMEKTEELGSNDHYNEWLQELGKLVQFKSNLLSIRMSGMQFKVYGFIHFEITFLTFSSLSGEAQHQTVLPGLWPAQAHLWWCHVGVDSDCHQLHSCTICPTRCGTLS